VSEGKEMSFLGHIGELRAHLVRSIIAIVIGAFIVGFNIEWIMDHDFFRADTQRFPHISGGKSFFAGIFRSRQHHASRKLRRAAKKNCFSSST